MWYLPLSIALAADPPSEVMWEGEQSASLRSIFASSKLFQARQKHKHKDVSKMTLTIPSPILCIEYKCLLYFDG